MNPFATALGCQVEPALTDLATRLGALSGLGAAERHAVRSAATTVVSEAVHSRVSRVLLLELNAARVSGRLAGADPRQRWADFLAQAARPQFWTDLATHYPTLDARLRRMVDNLCGAAYALAERFAADRDRLGGGDLVDVSFGAGDSHRGGHSVAIVRCAGRTVVYKPRSVRVDAALAGFLDVVFDGAPPAGRIHVPPVLDRPGYGWAEHVTHRLCADDTELDRFYRGLGHWVAVMRLLGGSDLHAENVIACGPIPVVVDCETLFTPLPPPRPSGLGQAVDLAGELVEGTALRTGLLPGRGQGLGWRGVDLSAGGALPGEQPAGSRPVIVDAGTDRARLGMERFELPPMANRPSAQPVLARFWDRLLAGFDDLTDRLTALDRAGRLEPALAPFADCPVRVVVRPTESYAELGRMLWHPASLHDEPQAVARATRVLARMAEYSALAPADPAVIAAEIADLLDGDTPFFTAVPRTGRLCGPRETTWLPRTDLVADALRRWRVGDLPLERRVIHATLVSAYLNEGSLPDDLRLPVTDPRHDDRDRRRRALAAGIVGQVRDTAITAPDGTVTWVAPVFNDTGWAVQPLNPDLYAGAAGVAVLLAAYQREAAAGRADPVDGLAPLLAGTLASIRAEQDWRAGCGLRLRPLPPGGYVGLGSRIWAWLLLDRWGATDDGLDRARAQATQIPAAIAIDDTHDVLTGTAGAIVPLLHLAERTGERRWVGTAVAAGERLLGAARRDGDRACWPGPRWPDGLGGFAHGATGIGWALHRLGRATGDARFTTAADAARAFEESLYDPAAGTWRDLRWAGGTASAWCHGAVGIGLAAADLGWSTDSAGPVDVVRRAAAAAWRTGLGWNHNLCHGDLGTWELLTTALAAGAAPDGLDRATLDGLVLSGLEEHGPVSGIARAAFAPGLLLGLGGVAYQLLRMHPDAGLPSALTLGGLR